MMAITRYLAAFFYDLLILTAIFFGFTFFCVWINQGEAIKQGTHWFQLALVALIIIYYVASYQFGQQTIGQKAWRLKLISLDGPLTKQQIFLRLLLILPTGLISILMIQKPSYFLTHLSQTRLIHLT